jgi:hypothetical protein
MELRREIHEGLNVIENWNSANEEGYTLADIHFSNSTPQNRMLSIPPIIVSTIIHATNPRKIPRIILISMKVAPLI